MFAKGRNTVFKDMSQKGENGHTNTLTASQVLEIVKRYTSERTSRVKLGKEYGVSASVIQGVVEGRTWSHVTGIQYGTTKYKNPRKQILDPSCHEELVRLKDEGLTAEELSKQFGLSKSRVWDIIKKLKRNKS